MIILTESAHLLDVPLYALQLQLSCLTDNILAGTLASPHIWDTGDGIGTWTGTAEGIKQQAINIIDIAVSIGYAFVVTIVILKVWMSYGLRNQSHS